MKHKYERVLDEMFSVKILDKNQKSKKSRLETPLGIYWKILKSCKEEGV